MTHTMTINGRKRKVPTEEAVYRTLSRLALAGNRQAFLHLDRMTTFGGEEQTEQAGIIVVPEPMSDDDWERMMKLELQVEKILLERNLSRAAAKRANTSERPGQKVVPRS